MNSNKIRKLRYEKISMCFQEVIIWVSNADKSGTDRQLAEFTLCSIL